MNHEITAQLIMDLRRRTGVGMTKCKEALTEAKGDIEKAIHILRKKGVASAVKKESRETKEGVIGVGENESVVTLIEVNAETDSVIQNERFKEFLSNLCEEALSHRKNSVEDLLACKYTKQPLLSIDEYRAEIVHSLGENIQVKRILNVEKIKGQSIGVYSHMQGKIVAVVILSGAENEKALAREVAMHVAAEAPEFLNMAQVPEEVKKKEEEIARSQIQKNKPEAIIQKILKGKLNAFYEQSCLESQKFIKEPSLTIKEFIGQKGKDSAKKIEIVRFIRWQMGA